MKTLEEIESYLMEKTNENTQAIEVCQENIKKADQSINRSEAELLAAEAAVNADDYNKAKNDLWTAQHSKELFLKQLDKLKREPLISKKEYSKLLDVTSELANAAHEDQNQRAALLIAEMKSIAEESRQTQQQANALMHVLQREVFKEPEGMLQLENGNKTWSSDKEYKNQKTVHAFYNSKVRGSNLEKLSGCEPERQKVKYWGQ